jgi:hypothetical protein
MQDIYGIALVGEKFSVSNVGVSYLGTYKLTVYCKSKSSALIFFQQRYPVVLI